MNSSETKITCHSAVLDDENNQPIASNKVVSGSYNIEPQRTRIWSIRSPCWKDS